MNIKNNKGITGVDLSIAMIVILIFVSLVTTLIFNYTKNAKEVTRKSTATYMIIDILEYAKNSNYEEITQEMINDYINNNNNLQVQGYVVSALVEGPIDLFGENAENVMKKITAKVKYYSNNKEQELSIYTIVQNINYIRENTEEVIWSVDD